jgi:hypothetical protein
MMMEVCDVCGELIVEVSRENGRPSIQKDKPVLTLKISPTVITVDGGISKEYMLCSTRCHAQFAGYMHMCFSNPKYSGLPLTDVLEGFINGELKPLVEVQAEESEVTGEQHGQPTGNNPDPNISRILSFTRPTESTPTTSDPVPNN